MRPLLRGPLLAAGLGAMAGAFEIVQISARLALDLSFTEGLLLGLLGVVTNALLGAALGLLFGAVAEWRWFDRRPSWVYASVMAGVALLLGAFFLGFAAKNLLDQGRPVAAAAFALSPIGLAGVVWYNANYWLRREEVGEEHRLGWTGLSLGMALLIVSGVAAALSARSFGGPQATSRAPSVLLITVDTLRRDHVSAYGQSPVQTPNIDALASRGVLFLDAITPLPETAPAHSAMLSGRHPFRSGVLSNGDVLRNGTLTLAERLEEEGYARAAFVSAFAVDARTGLDQGFEIYDDDFLPVRGAARIRLIELALRAWMRLGDPTALASFYERPAPDTLARALAWAEQNREKPFFLWVHLFEPHSPYEPHGLPGFEDNGSPGAPALDHRRILEREPGYAYTEEERARLRRLYAEEVAYVDQQIGAFLEGVGALELDRPLAVLLTADHGEMLGEHGVNFNHHGIWEDVLKVPLVVVPPDLSKLKERRVAQQVRLMDVATTVTDIAGVTALPSSEGFPLLALAEGLWDRGASTLLLGRRGVALSEGLLYGYRSGGVKYHLDPVTGAERLYDIHADPAETQELSAKLPELLVTARERVREETRGQLVQPQAGGLDPEVAEKLKALGYQE